tara:strand:+ start:31239 stop:32201 length:963 start_codon:yes stop_codon:yes gene_type:complete
MRIFLIIITLALLSSCKPKIETEKEVKLDAKELTTAVLAAGKLYRIDSFPSAFVAPRTVDIWTPENYSEDKKYAVVYMHDGQSLFDATTTWNSEEWKVDETASQLMKTDSITEFIVVGIHSISELRHFDYFPRKAFLNLSQKDQDSIFNNVKETKPDFSMESFKADDYLSFIVNELKPWIDKNYHTATGINNNMVAGSSMGGLISMYAICEYPSVFGAAACISTHWPGFMPKEQNPMPEAFFQYLRKNLPSPKTHRFYFDFGTETLDQYYPQYEIPVNTIFAEKGYSEENFRNLKFEGTDHSEASWQKRLDIPFTFLFKK